MKKLLTVLILAALALFMCTCSASAEAAEEALGPEDFSDFENSIHGDGSIRAGSISDIAIGDILIIVEDENNSPELVIIWRSQPMDAPPAPSSENAD